MTQAVQVLSAARTHAAIMGVVNVTPDSFSDGGAWNDPGAVVARVQTLLADGAEAIDLGGESTRPGSLPVSPSEELARVIPALRAIRAAGIRAPLTIDTSKAVVAHAALDAGADGINDVTAGRDPELLALAAHRGCALVLMHAHGTSDSMHRDPRYDGDVVSGVLAWLDVRLRAAIQAGVRSEHIVLDPGIGFGKNPGHNLAVLRGLPRLAALGRPLLVGVSRKRFLGALADVADPAQRDGLSQVVHGLIAPWCAWLRVHDVAGARRAVALAQDMP